MLSACFLRLVRGEVERGLSGTALVLTVLFSPSIQPLRLYVLGQKAMESEKEDSLAAGHVDRGSRGHLPHRWHCHSCYGHWHPGVRWEEGECGEQGAGAEGFEVSSEHLSRNSALIQGVDLLTEPKFSSLLSFA